MFNSSHLILFHLTFSYLTSFELPYRILCYRAFLPSIIISYCFEITLSDPIL